MFCDVNFGSLEICNATNIDEGAVDLYLRNEPAKEAHKTFSKFLSPESNKTSRMTLIRQDTVMTVCVDTFMSAV